ncbi:RhuM family protein [Agathobacter sp.]|uniref:RhuM family protein n=1 Tax=Agathobacter sp. TaxID=2021311 RepID=UPI003AB48E7B
MIFLKNEIVLFTDGDINIEVELSPELETVWLTQKQMGELFEVKQATLSEHINNIISSGELDETSIGFSDKSSGGRKPKIYNLDMILSVGYRVNSKRGIAFRRWANSVLKKYVIQGYAINEKRLQALERTVDIQTKMLASTLEVEESLFLEFLARNNALYRDDNKIISDGALVAITLMIAESRPEEKDIMVNLVMNFLTM